MSDFSPILVLQIENKQNSNMTWQKYKLNLRNSHLKNLSLSKGVSIPFSIQLPSYVIPSLEYSLVDRQAFIRNELHVRIEELNAFACVYIVIKKPAMILNSPLTINFIRFNFCTNHS